MLQEIEELTLSFVFMFDVTQISSRAEKVQKDQEYADRLHTRQLTEERNAIKTIQSEKEVLERKVQI